MKNFCFAIAFLAILCQPTSRLMAQNQQKNTSQVIGELLFALLLSDNNKPAKTQSTNTINRSEVLGVWEFPNGLSFIEKNGNYSESTFSYSEITFSGTYKLSGQQMKIYDNAGNYAGSWTVSLNGLGNRLTMSAGTSKSIGKFKCSVEDYFDQKKQEQANLEANTARYVTQQQSYIQRV